MNAGRQICEYCAKDEAVGVLTPIHVNIKGITKIWYFHNRHNKDCLTQFIAEMRAIYEYNQENPQSQLLFPN